MNVKKPEGYDFPLNLYRTLCVELDSDARLPEEITPDEKKGFKYLISDFKINIVFQNKTERTTKKT